MGEGPVTMYWEVVYCGGQWVHLTVLKSPVKLKCAVQYISDWLFEGNRALVDSLK